MVDRVEAATQEAVQLALPKDSGGGNQDGIIDRRDAVFRGTVVASARRAPAGYPAIRAGALFARQSEILTRPA